MRRWVWVAAVALVCGGASAQQSTWTVKPQWVKAHEDFLASDAMRGRGSATHDEEVTATYVASEFEGYGLTTAPGMSGYIQAAEVIAPVLDGHAVIASGSWKMEEGPGVTLVMSPGTSVSGPLVKLRSDEVATTKIPEGAVVVMLSVPGEDPNAAMAGVRPLMRAGAAAIVMLEGPSTERMYQAYGGKTRVPVRLAEKTGGRAVPTLLALDAAHLEEIAKLGSGSVVSVEVKQVAQQGKRETYNAIGYLPGTDAKAGTILLTAHLDHLGVGTPEDGDGIWNGANDDAAGTTAVLELAHALATGPRLKRSVLFVCYGSEELGEIGSTYFGMHPPVPLKDLVANLEFEMIGNQDPKMPKGVLLLTGWDRSNLGPTLAAHGALVGPDPYPEQHYFERSDNYALALKGVVAHTAAGWGDPPTYHRPNDDMAHLDLPFMTAAIQSLVEPMRWLADSNFKPEWNKGGQPKEQ